MKNCAILVLLLAATFCGSAQNASLTRELEGIAAPGELRSLVESLADDLDQGRECGTQGHFIASNSIVYNFRRTGLLPYNGLRYYTQSFRQDTLVLRNVAGIIRSNTLSSEYIIVTAHYDHIGTINGRIYNGADDNASGVAMLVTLARMFSKQSVREKNLSRNIIFLATDGKEHNNAGAEWFARHLKMQNSQIVQVINLDMTGTSLVPPEDARGQDYIIALGGKWADKNFRSSLLSAEARHRIGLYIDFTFYGSRKFTDVAYRMSDQVAFADRSIPSVLFTSGFHDHTYKPTDDIGILDFNAMSKRTMLIYYYIRQMASSR